MRTCELPECPNKHKAKGLCDIHWKRHWRNGNYEMAIERHGMMGTPEYHAWSNMIQRCNNPKNNRYHNYGKRGITVCEEWLNSFSAFFKDIGPRPSSEYSLERVDTDKGYMSGNVRWATDKEQSNNRTSNHYIVIKGEKKSLMEWTRHYNVVKYATAKRRIYSGWLPEKALTTMARPISRSQCP